MDIKNIIADGPQGIKFISGGSGVYDLINLPKSQLVHLVNSLLQLEDIADIIIFDTGAGISDNIIHLVASSTDVIIVANPEPTSIMDAYALVKTINEASKNFNLKLVVNKAETEYEGAMTMENFSRVVKHYLNINVDSLGCIMNDESVPKSVKEQNPLLLNYPKSIAAKNIQDIANRYMGFIDESKDKGGVKGFITRLIKGLAKS
jgi:flagellar biosynthesis protein FlhG